MELQCLKRSELAPDCECKKAHGVKTLNDYNGKCFVLVSHPVGRITTFAPNRLIQMLSIIVYVSLSLTAQAKTLETVGNLDKAHVAELDAYNKYNKFAEQAERGLSNGDQTIPLSGVFQSSCIQEIMQPLTKASAEKHKK